MAACAYEEPIRSWIIRLKYGGLDAVAPLLAAVLQAAWRLQPEAAPDPVIPVPLHPSRLRQRGFNQALLLAQHLAPVGGIHPDWLGRRVPTRPQVELGGAARRRNPEQAFEASPEVAGQSVWVLDDVMTTGATLQEIARTLKQAGARKVQALVVARRFREAETFGPEGG